MADVIAIGREELDEAKTIAAHGIVAESILLSVGDKERTANVPER